MNKAIVAGYLVDIDTLPTDYTLADLKENSKKLQIPSNAPRMDLGRLGAALLKRSQNENS